MSSINRREVLAAGLFSAVTSAARSNDEVSSHRVSGTSREGVAPKTLRPLDRFIDAYRHSMDAPALTLGLASRDGPIHTAAYGFVDVAARTPATVSHLFQIGSISKSFVALLILQLHEAGKVKLDAPILGYLPWLPIDTELGEITVHHLLTHSSGMPEDAEVLPASPGSRLRQTFAPGSHFHYSNWGYEVLGALVEKLHGRHWSAILTERILAPLGMNDTAPLISSDSRPRIAQSYVPLHDDRPYVRHAPLVPAGNLTVTMPSGCIASTPGDMAKYLQMILNRGSAPAGRIISAESFALFSKPHIAAPDLGPSVSYGYGIMVDELDGHKRLKHTGGMVSFVSSLQVDLDSGFGAFTSVNTQQGYRPNAVSQYALRLLRAQKEAGAPPPVPTPDEQAPLTDVAGYTGIFLAPDGARFEVRSEGNQLFTLVNGASVALQPTEPDVFVADHPELARFPIVFGREPAPESSSAQAQPNGVEAPTPTPVREVSYGSHWYAHPRYKAPTRIVPSPEVAACVGVYYSENPWHGTVVIVERQGQLWAEGVDPLVPVGSYLFRVGADTWSPELAEFSNIVDGAPQRLEMDGGRFLRIG
jgi:D-alanyl-D-alanine carboxypeptidase